ncbi:MAG TPA: DUF971 domain-containing protein [Candidatus Kapabacteria bacterium]|nr:DUF971 domain-containing protein [Candidatus Kapabacteria bacterium]
MRPTQIKRNNATNSLVLTWDDGHTSDLPLQFLRDECPCAGCKGETILGTHYPPPLRLFHDGMYLLEKLTPIGQYAIQAVWKDGHDTGIYSWEYLRMLEEELKQQPK